MGTFSVTIEIGDPQGEHWERVEALVDTGASFTVVPASLLRRLGVNPMRLWPFYLADGRQVELDIGETRVRVNGESATTIVVFGAEGVQPLLGAHALEGLRLAPDPVGRRLVPVPGLLMASFGQEAADAGAQAGQRRPDDAEPGAADGGVSVGTFSVTIEIGDPRGSAGRGLRRWWTQGPAIPLLQGRSSDV